ncbi:MAG: type I methionyl aminopeptidase [SAR324 cluster bacterium]|nr:type I methionyl aminopeptidase [SAR324 cluster bacterium]
MHQRNDPCWCGSGNKYKKCHMAEDQQKNILNQSPAGAGRYTRTKEFIEGMVVVGRLVKSTLDMVEGKIKAGITTDDINDWVHAFTLENNAIPATLNYNGYPKSCCTSVNEVVCHGIPCDYILKEGDIINVDITSILDGYFGDASRTFYVGNVSDDAKKITEVTRRCLELGIEAAQPGGNIGDIGHAIQTYAHDNKCTVVEQFVGHGIGRTFHDEPQVPHFGRKGSGPKIVPGMFFTIEPMINLGRKGVRVLADRWTAITIDGALTAQFEHTLYISDSGPIVLAE